MSISLGQLLQTMVQNGGSDLHVASNSPPMIRVRGDMAKLNVPPLTPAEVEQMIMATLTDAQRAEIIKDKNLDYSFKASGIGIFRVNIFYQRHGMSFVMRVLTESPPEIDKLNLPAICKTACSYSNGLVLVTGPTGSGKSTTLAAMLNYINQTTKGHILTLEDPIEFQHESKMGMVNQRALGAHFPTFASAMKAALREDPDVILIGEMRDAETVALALKAAETGHLVFSTLHTNSASKTIDRIINTFPAEEQPQIRTVLSETLKVVIAQRLIPTADKKRRIGMHDILVNTSAVGNLIREGKTFQLVSAMQTGKKDGMQVFEQVLMEAVKRGEVTGEDAWEHAGDKAMFAQWAPKPELPPGYVPGPATSQAAAGSPSTGQTSASLPGAPKKIA
ncbi:MAG: type IV pilus twitching motility protein PilT [Cryobacterium sp.]|nr:type IV pilus twitching motility protein PilT [Oligoflexia bacterium]